MSAIVTATVAQVQKFLSLNHTPLFRDYSDHSTRHFGEVMESSVAVLSPTGLSNISSGDAAIIALSAMIHDIAMHIDESGLLYLLQDPKPSVMLRDRKPWSELWHDYAAEVRRYDASRIREMFGDGYYAPPKILDDDIGKWTLLDRMYAGEFVRRHHPRLAHEISVHGFPGPDKHHQLILQSEDDISDIAGVVSRSHGHSLREFLPYIDKMYHIKEYRDIHIPFCMVILRIADYIQVQRSRAPSEAARIRCILSPYSQGEWSAHAAIKNITFANDDPELIFVNANPKNPTEYAKCKRLIEGFQSELDRAWAVLGEVYGRQLSPEKFGLAIRRVRSNIDPEHQWGDRVDFFVEPKQFRSSPGVLELLVGPLYNNNPITGIREIVQNSIDACRERQSMAVSENYEPEVRVSLSLAEEGELTISIEDNGIGMTEEVISDYFLVAGSSYRGSLEWKKKFEDDQGKSKVIRTGKFGIGVLSSLLVGARVRVSTSHVAGGIEFLFSETSAPVHLYKADLPERGTIVSIEKVNLELLRTAELEECNFLANFSDPMQRLLPGHVDAMARCLGKLVGFRTPRIIVRSEEGYERIVTPEVDAPLTSASHRSWAYVDMGSYGVHWRWDPKWELEHREANFRIYCNGMFVNSTQKLAHDTSEALTVIEPQLSFVDPDGNVPLNLQRSAIDEGLLLGSAEFTQSVCHRYAESFAAGDFSHILNVTRDPWFAFGRTHFGWILGRSAFMERAGVTRIVNICDGLSRHIRVESRPSCEALFSFEKGSTLADFDMQVERILTESGVRRRSTRRRMITPVRWHRGSGRAVAIILSDGAFSKRLQEKTVPAKYIQASLEYRRNDDLTVVAYSAGITPDEIFELQRFAVELGTLQRNDTTLSAGGVLAFVVYNPAYISVPVDKILLDKLIHTAGSIYVSYSHVSQEAGLAAKANA